MMVQKLRKLKLAAAQLTSGQSKNNLVFFFGEIKVFLGRENLGAHGFESGPLAQGTISRLCDKLEVEASCWRDGKQELAGAEPAARGCCVGFSACCLPDVLWSLWEAGAAVPSGKKRGWRSALEPVPPIPAPASFPGAGSPAARSEPGSAGWALGSVLIPLLPLAGPGGLRGEQART